MLVIIFDYTVKIVSRRQRNVQETFVGDMMKLKTHELRSKRSSHEVNYIIRYENKTDTHVLSGF